MLLLKNLKISYKVILVAFIPLTLFVISGIIEISQSWKEYKVVKNMGKNMVMFRQASALVNELQKERGRTSLYLGNTAEGESDMKRQRQISDEKIEPFLKSLKESCIKNECKANVESVGESIKHLRSQIGSSIKDSTASAKAYTEIIESLIDTMTATANAPTTKGIGKAMTSMLLLESAKEVAGLTRATVSGILSKNEPISISTINLVITLKAETDVNMHSRALTFPQETIQKIKTLTSQEHWLKRDAVITQVIARYEKGNYGVEPKEFL